MSYTISEVAKMMGVNPSTLRYYDKEELLPDVKRVNGIRIFEDEDFGWLRVLNCLKNTGMPIRKIKRYVELAKYGDETLEERYELIKEQRQSVLQQIELIRYSPMLRTRISTILEMWRVSSYMRRRMKILLRTACLT